MDYKMLTSLEKKCHMNLKYENKISKSETVLTV